MRIGLLTTDNRQEVRDYGNPAPHFGTAPEALLQGFAATRGIEVHVVSCVQQPVQSPEKLTENIWFHSLHVPKTGWMRTGYQGCIRAVRKKLRDIRPDIVHGQGTERDCAISAVFSGFPSVLTIHGNMRLIARLERAKPLSYKWLAARLERFTLPRSDGVICITNYTREAVANLARRTWLVPNAVDAKFFEVEADARPDGAPVILCVGAVCVRKNQNAFIRALEPLAARSNFHLVFFGEAPKGQPYVDAFFRLVQSHPWCSYAGFADRERLRAYFRTASLLVLPSLEDNCPMVVLEAMAARVPVLAAKVGGVPDLVEDGKNGLFCDPLDAESMRVAVTRLLEDPSMGRQLAAEAKQRARERFHPRVIAEKHLEIYAEALRASA